MSNNLYYNKQLLSGICKVPRLTQSEYDALTTKPEFWILKDNTGSYKRLNADEVLYDNTDSTLTSTNVQDAIDEMTTHPADKIFRADRGFSHSSTQSGYWAAMLNSGYESSETAPTLPTANKWWHVLSMDWMGTPGPGPTTNWVSQLALPTQDGIGVYYRRNDNSNEDIDLATWRRLAEGDVNGFATGLRGTIKPIEAPWDVSSFTFDFQANVMYAITLGGGAGSGSHFYDPSLYIACCRSNNTSDVLQYFKIFGETNLITGATRAETGTNKFTITINRATRNMIFKLFST